MKRRLLPFFIVFLMAFILNGAEFRKDWKKAFDFAKKHHKRVFFVFHTDWCPHCRHLLSTTLKDPAVLSYFDREDYVLISINPEKDREAEKKFRVYGYPTMIIYDKTGKEIDRILGYLDSKQLIKTIENFKKGIGTLKDLLRKHKESPDDLELMFKIATKYIARAEFQKAINLLNIMIAKAEKKNDKNSVINGIMRKAYAYYKWKKFNMAANCVLEIAKKYPNSKEARDSYLDASYYAKKGGNEKRANELIEIFIKKYPDDPRVKKLKKKIKK